MAQNQAEARASRSDAARRREAKATFQSICAPCHGLDARGSDRGPDIASRPDVMRKTDVPLVKILTDGKSAGGMPSFASYSPAKLLALVAYLCTLQGRGKETFLLGDAGRGKTLFFGKAKCGACHMVGGQGGFFSEDLTTYGAGKGADEVRVAIVDPDRDLDPCLGLVTVTLADSTTISGVACNEDNFSLQLQTSDGVFHLLNKSDIRTQTYAGRSAMPSDYGSILSPVELNDVVSFLLHAAKEGSARKRSATPKIQTKSKN